jgi:hypothetical protein
MADTCTTHILDTGRMMVNAQREVRLERGGVRTETWTIDKDITRETYEKFKDAEGDVYVARAYVRDEPAVMLMPKADWERLVHVTAFRAD